eukprot:446209-Amphidinium_carterae.1
MSRVKLTPIQNEQSGRLEHILVELASRIVSTACDAIAMQEILLSLDEPSKYKLARANTDRPQPKWTAA